MQNGMYVYVQLNNGEMVDGVVSELTNEYFKLSSAELVSYLRFSDIKKIEIDDGDEIVNEHDEMKQLRSIR